MPLWVTSRVVIEEINISADADIFEQKFHRFQDAYEALKWHLARRAESLGLRSHYKGLEYRLYRQSGDPIAGTPSLIVVYTYTVDEVTIIGLRCEA
jgi:hypothetical protein